MKIANLTFLFSILLFQGCDRQIEKNQNAPYQIASTLKSAESTEKNNATSNKSNDSNTENYFDPVSTYSYPDDGVVIGQGWNNFTLRGTPARCVNVIEVPIESSVYSSDLKEIKSTYSLFKDESFSAAVSGSFGGFSGGASGSRQKSYKLDTQAINVLFEFASNVSGTQAIGHPDGNHSGIVDTGVFTEIENYSSFSDEAQKVIAEFATNPNPNLSGFRVTLTEDAKKLLENPKGLEEFKSVCGDGFVSAIHRGTDIKVIASYKSKKSESRRKFSYAVSAGGFGAKANASRTGEESTSEFDSETEFKIFQTGGIPYAPPNSFSGIRNLISDSSNFVLNPAAFEIKVTPYSSLGVFQKQLRTINQPTRLNELGRYYMMLRDLYQEVDNIIVEELSGPNERIYDKNIINAYKGNYESGLERFKVLKDQIQRDLIFIESSVYDCLNKKIDCTIKSAKNKYANTTANLESSSASVKAMLSSFSDESLRDGNVLTGASLDVGTINPQMLKSFLTDQGIKFATGEDLNKETIDSIRKSLGEDASELASIISQRKFLSKTLGSTEDNEINDWFFLKFYDYLIQLPLPEYVMTANRTLVEGQNVDVVKELRSKLYLHRLAPWKKYFCEEAMKELMCVEDSYLWNLLGDANIQKIGDKYKVNVTVTECRNVTERVARTRWRGGGDEYRSGIETYYDNVTKRVCNTRTEPYGQ